MSRLLACALALGLGAISGVAQSVGDQNLEIHGFATQSFLYSGTNNYLGMDTSSGSAAWTEAAINVQDQVSGKLRVGVQFHYTRLGNFGGDVPSIDWALGDYTLNRWMGLRAGKVKIRWGLYNDTQDYDPGYLWSLLPESIYGIDSRSTNLSQLGAELYGKVRLAGNLGALEYSGYYGNYSYSTDDGSMASFNDQGLTFSTTPGGKTPGFDLRWKTPLAGLKVGGSLMTYDAKGNLTNGTYVQPLAFWQTYFAEYEGRKLDLSAQYMKVVQYQTAIVPPSAPSTSGSDERAWFAMGGYHLTEKLQAGAYYTRFWVASEDTSQPGNFFHDWVVSGRYDIHSNFYAKLEGHFMNGNAVGFYSLNNPDGLRPRTNLLAAKIGFTF